MYNEKLMSLVIDQIYDDTEIGRSDITALIELLEGIDHDKLVGYLSYKRAEQLTKGT